MARSWPALCVVDVAATPGRIHEQDKNGFKSCLHQAREHSVQNLSPERPELAIPQHEHACIPPCLTGSSDAVFYLSVFFFSSTVTGSCCVHHPQFPHNHLVKGRSIPHSFSAFSFLLKDTLFGVSQLLERGEMAVFTDKALFVSTSLICLKMYQKKARATETTLLKVTPLSVKDQMYHILQYFTQGQTILWQPHVNQTSFP